MHGQAKCAAQASVREDIVGTANRPEPSNIYWPMNNIRESDRMRWVRMSSNRTAGLIVCIKEILVHLFYDDVKASSSSDSCHLCYG